MFTQGRNLWSGALLLLVFSSQNIIVKGTSWSAEWSWPSELTQVGHNRFTDDEIIDLLYSRPSRSSPDHPSFEERRKYQIKVEDYDNELPQNIKEKPVVENEYEDYVEFDLKRNKPRSSTYMTTSFGSKPQITSYAHSIIHKS